LIHVNNRIAELNKKIESLTDDIREFWENLVSAKQGASQNFNLGLQISDQLIEVQDLSNQI